MESALDSLGKPVQQAPYDEIPTAFLCDGQMPAPGQEEEVKQDFDSPWWQSRDLQPPCPVPAQILSHLATTVLQNIVKPAQSFGDVGNIAAPQQVGPEAQ